MSASGRSRAPRRRHAGVPNLFGRSLREGTGPHKRLETTGLIVIAILILAITVLRYWHNITWRAR